MVAWDLLTFLLSFITSSTRLFGIVQVPAYDVIVVGSGAGGSVVAQTLAEGAGRQLEVLLLERGGERVASSRLDRDQDEALRSRCADASIVSAPSNVVMATGNCLGGATSINGGAYIEETRDWFAQAVIESGLTEPFYTQEQVDAAFAYVRGKLAPDPIRETPGTGSEALIRELAEIIENRPDFGPVNLGGQPGLTVNGVWRSHSIFDQTTRERRSADTILDRGLPNLTIRTNAKVQRIMFDGDFGIPFFVKQTKGGSEPRARCVKLNTLEVICVKQEGRIILSGGAIHTPVILQNSGIGPTGKRIKNNHVGQHLSDRVSATVTAFYKTGVEDKGEFEDANLVALQTVTNTESGTDLQLLYETLSVGDPSIWNYGSWDRSYLPNALRNGLWYTVTKAYGDFCLNDNDGSPVFWFSSVPFLCEGFVNNSKAGCDKNYYGMTVLNSQPTAIGQVQADFFGNAKVDVNYFNSPQDKEAFGIQMRTAHELIVAVAGTAAAQRPCASNDQQETCRSSSCPDLLFDSRKDIANLIGLLDDDAASLIPQGVPSVTTPPTLNDLVQDPTLSNIELGEKLSNNFGSSFHFAGTAAFGRVVDKNFKVIGAKGLYVVDGSVIPKTTRVNIMASILMLGRLAGVNAVAELPWR